MSLEVGDVVRIVNPKPEFLEAVFVDNMMDYGQSRLDAIIAKLQDSKRLWKVTFICEGSQDDEDDPPMASIEGFGFRCEVPSMIELSSLEKRNAS